MASSKNRQRALARAKAERQAARRAAAARRRRRIQAGVAGAVSLVVLVVGVVWAAGGFKSEPKKVEVCSWNSRDDVTNPDVRDVGKPPASGIPTSGTRTMTVTTSQGAIEIALDATKAPCATASFNYLAGKKFFANSICNRLTNKGTFALFCGAPEGTEPTGNGAPSYTFTDENVPPETSPSASPPGATPPGSPGASGTATSSATASPSATGSPRASASPTQQQWVRYPRGTVGLYNTGAGTNGSTFFISYKDEWAMLGSFPVIGKVVSGLDVVDKIAAGGVANRSNGEPASDGKPKTEVKIQTVTVGPIQNATPSPGTGSTSPTAPASSTTPTPSTSASTKP